MYLTALDYIQTEQVRQWRNQDISMFRTSFYLTKEMQIDFYNNVVCNRSSEHRYYAVMDKKDFVGMAGLTNISLENRNAEISIIINPQFRMLGIGFNTVMLLLEEGFKRINLDNIYGECYTCSPALKFWEKMIVRFNALKSIMPKRKFYNDQYWDSIYFNFSKKDF